MTCTCDRDKAIIARKRAARDAFIRDDMEEWLHIQDTHWSEWVATPDLCPACKQWHSLPD